MNCPACDHANVDGARYCAKCGALMPVAQPAGQSDPLIGTVVGGRFRITGLLGEGGMGRVYAGEQQMGTSVRKVAVKTLLQEFSKDPQVVARFMRECGTVVELEHPNTIKFYDFGQTDAGDLYIAMEFVDGKSLSDVIAQGGSLSVERVLNIVKQVAGSLQEAHDKGIIHRDLKPDNVVLTTRAGEADFVKVLDFGIAKRSESTDSAREQKLTQAGMVLGTPPYMSPEQFTGKELDGRSDVYSLAVMTYEMLTAKLPFNANTPWEWATQHMTVQPFPFEKTSQMAANIPAHLKGAVMKALSKERDQRQANVKAFYDELSGGRPSATIVPEGAVAAGGGMRTEAFAGPAPGATKPGATQIGEPFVPPMDALAPGGGVPGVGVPLPGGQHVPTTGGQAVMAMPPTPPAAARPGGGGNRGLLIGAAVGVGALMIVGLVFALKGGGGDDDETKGGTPAATTKPVATEEAASTTATTGSGPNVEVADTAPTAPTAPPTTPTQTAPPSTAPTKPTASAADPKGNAACKAAAGAALAGDCDRAKSLVANCPAGLRSEADAAIKFKCGPKIAPPPPPPPPPAKKGGGFTVVRPKKK
jgi:serine/threonine-protein kinase